MLVLLSFALVLVATVLLVLGLLNDDGLTLIYLSIASSIAAAVVLLAALRMNKPRGEHRAVEPAPLPEPAEVEHVAVAAMAGAGGSESSAWQASEQESSTAGDTWEEGQEVEFPIADYDTLTVGQILPLLPQLYADEIGVVEERERLGKARSQVLAKLAELREAASAPVPAATGADPLASYTEAPSTTWDDDDWFPIEAYESLSAAQIRPLLPELDDEELELVRTRELSLGRRRSLLDEIDRRLGAAAAATSTRTRKAAAKKSAPARRGAPTKRSASAKKAAPTKRSTLAKKAAPARKAAPASKAAVRKATAAAPAPAARKAQAKKAPAAKKAAPARKAPATKKAAPARKATTAKKASARKATRAKKATKRANR